MADVWVLVADRARTRLFSLAKDAPRMIEIEDFVNPAARTPGHERERAPPPRVHDRFGVGRHTIEAHTSPREKAALQFAATLGSYLRHAYAERRYQGLALVAPPGFLGMLNAILDANLCAAVVLRLSKNMTRASAVAIRAELPVALLRHGTTVITG